MSHVDEGTLHAYLDGELPAAERSTLDAHVAQCGACKAVLADERALRERAGQLLGLAQPVDRPAPPLQQLQQRPRPPRRPWHVRTSVAWAASIVLAIVVGYSVRGSGAPMSEQPAPAVATDGYQYRETPREEEQPRALATRKAPEQPVDSVKTFTFAAPPPAPVVVAIAPPSTRADAERDEFRAANQAEATERIVPRSLVATEWPIIRRGSARDLLGTDPVGIPGLAVRQIRRSPAPDGTVLVEQQIDSTTIIQLYQRAFSLEREAAPIQGLQRDGRAAVGAAAKTGVADRLARYVGGLRVEIAGPLSQDSLNRLLEQLKPLP